VNDPFVTALTYIVPFPTSAAALAVIGVRIGVEPAAIEPVCVGVTVVLAALAVSVTVPLAFDLPAASWPSEMMIFFRSVSVMPGM
jgi:hypothetical protein